MRIPGTVRAALSAALLAGAVTSMASSIDLNQSAWTVTALPGQPALTQAAPTLRFADGRVSGSDGCNRYQGTYRSGADGFEVEPTLASTRMACPEPVMHTADAFIAALLQARGARVDGDRLELRSADGSLLLTATRSPPSAR